MASTHDSGIGHGSNGAPQTSVEEQVYPNKAAENEVEAAKPKPPVYVPSPKHNPGSGWGSENPISTMSEGQKLIDTGYQQGRQIYNVTSNGEIVKFQPDGTPQNGYHSYLVTGPRDIPASVLKQMLKDGLISKAQYNKIRKGKNMI